MNKFTKNEFIKLFQSLPEDDANNFFRACGSYIQSQKCLTCDPENTSSIALSILCTSIETKVKIIRTLGNRVGNLWNSESVRDYINKSPWKGKRKNLGSYAYRDWCRWKGFDYEFKKYREEASKLPYIPLEKELDQLIAGCNAHYACFFYSC